MHCTLRTYSLHLEFIPHIHHYTRTYQPLHPSKRQPPLPAPMRDPRFEDMMAGHQGGDDVIFTTKTFGDLTVPLGDNLGANLDRMGLVHPTKIQEAAVPAMAAGGMSHHVTPWHTNTLTH